MNFWDYHIDNHESYIRSYGEGEGSATLRRLFKYINNGDTVLDVGCGPGCIYGHNKDFEKKSIHYRGVDASPKFIEACRKRFPEAEFYVDDAEQLMILPKSWDVVVLKDVLEHLNGYRKAIGEAFRIAKKRVIICLWVGLMDKPDNIKDMGDGGYHSEYNREQFIEFIHSIMGPSATLTEDEEHENRNHYYYIINL